jgi:hypothetical protein
MKLLSLGVLGLLALAVTAQAAEPNDQTLSRFMRAKLGHSQKILEALAVEDFGTIAKSAQEISLISQAELWQVFKTPEYLQHSNEFRRAADAVTDAAKKKNLDGAALAYMDMTLKCVNCHKYVRKVRMARNELPQLRERLYAALPRSNP